MELKRLWKTLTYFEVIPFPYCLLKLFQSKNIDKNMIDSMVNLTLISDDRSSLAQETINSLQQKNLPLRIISPSPTTAFSSSLTEIIDLNLEVDTPFSSLLERVNKIIFFPQNGIDKLLELVNQNLQQGEIILFDFQTPNQNLRNIWGAVDDVVMGGVSSSNLILSSHCAIFTGIVSTNNNGGFASVRSKNFNQPWDLSNYQGIRLKVKGDGKRYKFITRCEGKWDGISYCYSFDTIVNEWLIVDIIFDNLIPVFRAKTLQDADKFDSSKVYSLQLMLSKFEYDGGYNPTFEAGRFALEIESIKAYGKKDSPELIFMGNPELWADYNINKS
ncbi:similar to nucleoside-diphosphate-sugar epimerases [Geminocystis sp. NIES-3708]|uniref:CIA30 family protein n=1 Tax=Geminocystis sp. NIES-3708 TaxID=1615909 RepID=UPI0005FC4896|nr:CIA30 family protein [Geminocystis sp. NIES-3708]BAQ62891.1 similar to nucleoside-diphosphate-sugar epimerases [Geminocystis sp. NIES-3708]